MRVFFKNADLGWMAVHRNSNAKDPTQPGWLLDGRNVEDPEVSQFVRNADELYVFPVPDPLEPRRDNKHLRRLDGEARRSLVRLLTHPGNWYHGVGSLITGRLPRNIGVMFRSGGSQLVLFFSPNWTSSAGWIQGTFNGQYVMDIFEDDAGKEMEKWSHRFAQPELAPPKRSTKTTQRTSNSEGSRA
jgi:hypothetical protein